MRLTGLWILLAAAPAARGQCWTETNELTASDATADAFFGISVALDGATALVGAAWDDANGTLSGSAYVVERDLGGPGAWGERAKLTASDASEGDWFGISVAIFGDTAVVGASRKDVVNEFDGAAYVFERHRGGTNAWSEVARLTAPVPDYLSYFGGDVAIFGDTIVVGCAHEATVYGENSGTAYVFERDLGGADAWGLAAQLFSSDLEASDQFGDAVTIWDDTIVVGAILSDEGVYNASGSAYVFERNQGGPGAWGEVAKLIAHDPGTDSFFGYAAALHGDTLLVGALYDDYLCRDTWWCDAGAAYVFERDLGGPDAWGEVAKLTPSMAVRGGYFGQSVALYGDTALVGAYRGPPSSGGAVFAFERDLWAPGGWGEADVMVSPAPQVGGAFGSAVALSGTTAFVGAHGENAAAARSGAAHVFERDPATPYCTAGVSTSGCRAILTACGTPSASAPSGFTLTARDVEGGRAGLFYFGANGRQAVPWGKSSYQCVAPPVVRTGILTGVGTPRTCEGTFTLDLNTLWCSSCPHASANPGAGATIQVQLWYRQPPGDDIRGTNLSGAVELTLAP